MARVEWSRFSGDEVEAVAAILLCREFPTATRFKPSRGDAGIDVWVPGSPDPTVFQIKRYTGNIDATRRRHIKESWDVLQKYVEENSIALAQWNLVMPENPTKEQFQWFENLTSDTTYPCIWRGIDYLDGLAAKYPEVIDYYFKDGKERLEEVVKSFLAAAGLGGEITSPSNSVESLQKIHDQLNKFDPHFYYDFSVDTISGDDGGPPVQNTPRLVASVQLTCDDQRVTYRIIARYNGATSDRPVPGSMQLVAETGSELQSTIEDWATFGTPLSGVPAKDVSIDLPGGFGGNFPEGYVSIGTQSESRPGPEVTIRITEPDGTPVASLDFVTEEVTSGVNNQGLRVIGHDMPGRLVRYELRATMPDRSATTSISVEDPVGHYPLDMLPGIRFVSEIVPSRQMQLYLRNGPALVPPWEIPQRMIDEQQGRLWIDMCESLSTIQQHVIERFAFPRLPSQDPYSQINSWIEAAHLLRGEAVNGTWSELQVHLHPGQGAPDDGGTAIFNIPFSVRIGTKDYALGAITMQIETFRVDRTRPIATHDYHEDLWLVPGANNSATVRMASGS